MYNIYMKMIYHLASKFVLGHDAPILAGMWGVKTQPLRQALRLTLLQVLRDASSYAPRQVCVGHEEVL
jgi:hypothetical protein